MGFVGIADATMCSGEVLVAPSVGLLIAKGKSSEPAGGGTCAGGAGSGLVCGDQVIGTGGVEGLPGGAGGIGVPAFMLLLLMPQPVENAIRAINIPQRKRSAARLPNGVNKLMS